MSTPDTDRLLCWVDVETTGLDETRGAIPEVGLILTDWTLRELDARSWCVRFVGRVDLTIATMHGPQGSGLLRVADPGLGLPHNLAIWSCDGLPVTDVEAMAARGCTSGARGRALWAGRNVAFGRAGSGAHAAPARRHPPPRRGRDHRPDDPLAAWAGITVPKDPTAGTKHRPSMTCASLRVMRRVRLNAVGAASPARAVGSHDRENCVTIGRARRPHVPRRARWLRGWGMTARCASCSAEVRGMIAWGTDHGDALTAANAIPTLRRDRGWACRANGDHCERHR